ncbi:alpha/beta fold hydrolase [Maritalea mediterranea]|uniref:Alpha/beta hydrolase n=1 Tax=Maritalea mediterranea TaxID=2909667 RepID=A0ABS9E382_9HYPH|nr:alpha/beta hydrolase [Maritalea mediterranea]MCF4097326.1 alpha/beta hydrolase [Maritalea mediterranea]
MAGTKKVDMIYRPEFLPATFVERDHVRLAYGDVGPKDGPGVFLVHGLAASGMQFTADAHYFADLGYRVIVPDLRGHGRSGKPAQTDLDAFSIAELSNDILAVADHVGAQHFHYVGNSLGGIIALWALADHGPRFRSFASFGTTYSLTTPKAGVGVLKWIYKVMGPNLIGKIGAIGTTKNKQARPLVEAMLRSIDVDVVTKIVGHVGDYDLIDRAVKYDGPILMLKCGQDKSVNAALSATLAQMQPRENFTLIDVPNGGHCANLDATDEVRQHLLNFWQRVEHDRTPLAARS